MRPSLPYTNNGKIYNHCPSLCLSLLKLHRLGLCQRQSHCEGIIYCDTCRIQFLTKLSEFLEERDIQQTDASGTYKVEMDKDHEEDTCDVVLLKSPRKDCSEVDTKSHIYERTCGVFMRDNAKNVTFNKEAMTNALGTYKVEVGGDHEEDTCKVVLLKSSRKDCSEVDIESHM
ncbi:hypothetical protein Fmac_008506 [Flemingia macrophylla]|uniref:Uncharacterized protein n=1 Tax=Flemingia macrophylla TaxID=520843 RepID=A0ABD1MXL2_9FABA